MKTPDDNSLTFRELTPDDAPAAHALLSASLVWDTFSVDLMREKLFGRSPDGKEPAPRLRGRDEVTSRVLAAEGDGEPVGIMQASMRVSDGAAWLGLFATDRRRLRRGVATRLYEIIEPWLREGGARQVDVLGCPGNYFAPGLDPRYTSALAFLERHGYERFGDCVNMIADLGDDFEARTRIADETRRLSNQGIILRRAESVDRQALDEFFSAQFGAGWRHEAELALANDPPGLHLVLREGRVLAFAAHSSQNREWGFFGPMGTAPELRGAGFGRVLLLACLQDLKEAGHKTAIIPWVGPIGFYARCTPCRVERVYWRYRKMLT